MILDVGEKSDGRIEAALGKKIGKRKKVPRRATKTHSTELFQV